VHHPSIFREHSLTENRTYDEYTSELVSGHIAWTPVHDSDEFWKENAARLNENDNEQLKWVLNLAALNPEADST
jgi:V-type H+-transporting ATPase subunit H